MSRECMARTDKMTARGRHFTGKEAQWSASSARVLTYTGHDPSPSGWGKEKKKVKYDYDVNGDQDGKKKNDKSREWERGMERA